MDANSMLREFCDAVEKRDGGGLLTCSALMESTTTCSTERLPAGRRSLR